MQRLRNLNLIPTGAPGIDKNPCTMPEATLYKETLTLGPIDEDELALFKAQFGALLAAPSSDERKLMLDRLTAYVIALRAIKHELNDIKFRGLNPEDTELGFSFIRPQFTVAGAAAVPQVFKRNWQIAFAAVATWYDWFWNGALTAYTMGKDFGLVITHLKSLVTPVPFMAECRFEVGRTGILIPFDVRMLRVGDTENGTAIVPIPTMILKPRASLYAQALADVAGTDEVALGGLVFGLGRVLKETTPTWLV
ncbi:unnamed protein product [marine sediment metagenome]|uniref:Uncharacterized protein n=1 Tax=marine sediment metagenome TaxID=412755 RepID=X1GTZ5_9ZZZZ